VLVSKDGRTLGKGHNQRVQKGSSILHGEMDALENAGRLHGSEYKGATVSLMKLLTKQNKEAKNSMIDVHNTESL
jgi:hypothetical protein